MERLICVFVCSGLLIGCSTTPIMIASTVQESIIEVRYCPNPEIPNRPILAISDMNDNQRSNPGEVAKHYQATIQQLIGYSQSLELELQKYVDVNNTYDKTNRKLNSTFFADDLKTR